MGNHRDIQILLTSLIGKNNREIRGASITMENRLEIQLLAKMSHEIRTQINSNIGLVELLEDTNLSDIQRKYIQLLKFSADRLLSVVNPILDFSTIESERYKLRKDKFDLIKLIENIVEYLQIKANKKGLDLHYKIDSKIPNTVIGDPDALSQILLNLLENAIKFTEKGFITLKIDIYDEDIDYLGISFQVKDTGIGIPNENISSVFEDFKQLNSSRDRKYEGLGLGLPISKEIIELMGGHVEVQSELGKGSKFTIYIKFSKDNIKSGKIEFLDLDKTTDEKINYEKLNILVAEDDLIGQKIIKNILEKNKWKSTIVSNGKEALEYFNHYNFDVILMDVFMPVMDGLEAAKEIRKIENETRSYTPIIALTAAGMKDDREKCLGVGMDEYILKPVRSDILYKTIIKVLNRAASVECIEIEGLLDRLDRDKGILKKLMEDLVSDDYEKEHLGNIKKYIEEADFKNLTNQIHKFKGSISNFGADNILSILEKMSLGIKDKDLNEISALNQRLEIEFKKTKNMLKEYYNSEFLKN